MKALRDYYSRLAAVHLKDCEAKYSAGNGWKGPAPSEEEHNRVNLYKRLGSGGVDFPAFFRVLREENTRAGSRSTSTLPVRERGPWSRTWTPIENICSKRCTLR